ncbi:MAG: NADH-quinone oxidoreductase subunit I 2 [Candidatus Poribacteria bacterium]|nr:MAG: NADH-quinone oxidoreductase subunit I 2 [Candidatus Poribacteria bacterium]
MRQYFRNIFTAVWTILIGMRITMRELFTPAVTREYPEHRPEIPDGFRGRLHNKIEDCVVCYACANICPVDCIYIEHEEAPRGQFYAFASNGAPIRRNATRFDIDMALCCYCGLCTEVCPTECLIMTKDFEYSTYDRQELIYHFAKPWPEAKPMPKARPTRRQDQTEEAAAEA